MGLELSQKAVQLVKDLRHIHQNSIISRYFSMGLMELNDQYNNLKKFADESRDTGALEILKMYVQERKQYIGIYTSSEDVLGEDPQFLGIV